MTIQRCVEVLRPAAVALLLVSAGSAGAAEIAPHRALYTMTLGATHGDAGVTAASGTMAYQWGETCEGWTMEQRYRLKMGSAESPDVSISSNFVTWEAKLDGPGKGGSVDFEMPEAKNLKLPPGVLFPSAHTIFLIDKAQAGENFLSKQVFDGATADGAVLVSAVIGPRVEPDAESAKKSPLLNRPGWRVRLAFFPADQKAEKPDYELGMLLLDNGVSRDMTIDYGDYSIRAKLDDIEALPKPHC